MRGIVKVKKQKKSKFLNQVAGKFYEPLDDEENSGVSIRKKA